MGSRSVAFIEIFTCFILPPEVICQLPKGGESLQKQVMKLPVKPALQRLSRVAAYARVSSGKDAMLHSLAAQVSYYSDLIQRHPGWRYAGVYADEATTGTKDNPRGVSAAPDGL